MRATIFPAFVGLTAIVALSGCMIITDKVSKQERVFHQKQAELEAKMHQKNKVVYAVKNIPQGTVIAPEALEEREVEIMRTPEDALTSSSLCVGRKAKYPIGAGQIVGQYDLAPQNGKQSAQEDQQ